MGNCIPARKDFFRPDVRKSACFDSRNFELLRLLNLPSVKNQYSEAFIQSCMALKLYETEESIFVGIKSSYFERVAPMILLFHKDKEVSFLKIQDPDFQKVFDFVFDTKFRKKKDRSFENIINVIFKDALEQNATDICFEPGENYYKLYYRCDGILKKKRVLPYTICRLVMDQIKIMARLNVISMTHLQEGHIEAVIDNAGYDIKISCMPRKFGEGITLSLSNSDFYEPSSSFVEAEQPCFC
ncbi:MAG: Flp pilus assembly complex ATPase component TadA [Treponemataceae bacterium]|nr:Flp pilus assembly complex ATPase component TadA [Treponemataceae bacterium]